MCHVLRRFAMVMIVPVLDVCAHDEHIHKVLITSYIFQMYIFKYNRISYPFHVYIVYKRGNENLRYIFIQYT